MKKVKAMFMGIAILAVIGGSFAFKAKHNYLSTLFYTTAATYVGKTAAIPATSQAQEATFGPYYYTIGEAGSYVTYTSTILEAAE